MRNSCGALLVLAFSLGIQAGSSTFTGHGTSARNPEFVTVSMKVHSDCYKTPIEAMLANNKITKEIHDYLQSLLVSGSAIDKVSTQGGTTRQSSRSVYSHGENTMVCPGGFEQITAISFRTQDLENFSATFAKIQTEILGTYDSDDKKKEDERTFVTIQEPSAGVCQKTQYEMSLEALKNAYGDARAQFDVVARECGITGDVAISSFGDGQTESYSQKSYRAESAFDRSARAVSLSFEPLSESRTIVVKYSYNKTSFTCEAAR